MTYKCKACGKELFNNKTNICPSCKIKQLNTVKKVLFIVAGGVAAVAGLYIIIPFDLIHDWIPGIGYIDDIIVAVIAFIIALGTIIAAIVVIVNTKKIEKENNS